MTCDVTRDTTNVFSDIGLPDAGDRQTKTRLAMALDDIIKTHRLQQVETARLFGIAQPKMAALANYRLDGFSAEELTGCLSALNQKMENKNCLRMNGDAGEV